MMADQALMCQLLYIISKPISGLDHRVGDARLVRDLAERFHIPAPYVDEDCFPLIVHLFDWQSPPAVLWRIGAIVIDAFNGVLGGRARPHVLVEIRKTGAPPVAHLNTSGPVLGIAAVVRVVATVLHTVPDVIFRGFAKPVSSLESVLARLRGILVQRIFHALFVAEPRIKCKFSMLRAEK